MSPPRHECHRTRTNVNRSLLNCGSTGHVSIPRRSVRGGISFADRSPPRHLPCCASTPPVSTPSARTPPARRTARRRRSPTHPITRTSFCLPPTAYSRSMRHRVKHDVDPHRIPLLLRQLPEVPLVLALALPTVAVVGVVADHHHHPPLVVEDRAII